MQGPFFWQGTKLAKKVMAILMSMLFCVQLFPRTFAEEENGILQFADDFSGGLAGWNIEKKQFLTIGTEAALYNDNQRSCTATIAGETTRWGAVTVSFGINFISSDEGVFQLRVRNGSNGYFSMLLRPDKNASFRYLYKNGSLAKSETAFASNYKLKLNTDYQIKLVHTDAQTSVYAKESEESAYTKIGSLDVKMASTGSIYLSTSNLYCKITDFRVYNDNAGEFYFDNKLIKQKKGNTLSVCPVNKTGSEAEITYSSSNPSVISVDNSGNLAFLSGGKAVITATTVIDGKTYTDSLDAICTGVINTFGFNGRTLNMYTGDVANVCAVIRPDNVENKRVIWKTSDTGIIEISGKLDDEKTLTAKASGTATVTISSVDNPGRVDRLTVTVTDPPTEETEISFVRDSYKREIPEYYFGMHANPLNNISADKTEMLDKENTAAMMYKELNLDFIRFMLSDFDWEKGKYPTAAANIPAYSMSDIYTAGNTAGIPCIISVGDNDSAEKVVAMIEEIIDVTDQPIYIEMGNESWDISHSVHFPTVEDFTDRVKAVYTAVKALDENIKISVPVYEWAACESAKTDPSGSAQRARFALWNDGILAASDYYDAVVIHRYSGPVSWEKKTTTQLMDGFYEMMLSDSVDFADLEEHFVEKEIWVTEFGDLPRLFTFCPSYGYYGLNDNKYYAIQSESERNRLQYAKSVGNAVGYATRLMNFLNTPNVSMASYHAFNDPQCFGVIQGDVLLPNWYMFDKMGEVLSESTHYYKLKTESEENVTAYGFGTDNEVKTVVISNLSNKPISVEIEDYKIKKKWSYGGSNPLPDYGRYNTERYTDAPSIIPLPEEYDNDLQTKVSVEPYSITVAQVYDDALGSDADVDVEFSGDLQSYEGITTTGSVANGDFYLGGYQYIETVKEFKDAIIEFDFMFTNGDRLDFKFNLQKNENGGNQYYNQLYFFANGSTLYEKGRKVSVSKDGKMSDTRIQSNAVFEKNVNYRFKIVKNGKKISLYYMNLDEENPAYNFIETYTHSNINDNSGKVVISAATSGSTSMLKLSSLRVYDITGKDSYAIRNVAIEGDTVSCDVYPFGAMENALLYFAVYEQDRLIDVDIDSVEYTKDKASIIFQADMADLDSFKIFAWGQNTKMPLMKAREYTELLHKED